MAFVLWSKNYAPLLPHVGELGDKPNSVPEKA